MLKFIRLSGPIRISLIFSQIETGFWGCFKGAVYGKFKAVKHWIFDFDGTLVDSDGYFTRCINYALEPFGRRMERDFIETIRHRHPHQIFDGYIPSEDIPHAFERLKEIGTAVAEEIQTFDGIRELIETLDRRQNTVSIWTGRDRESTLLILKKQGLADAFEKIVTGTCVPQNKPEQDGLMEIQRHYRAKAHEMVMVGDHHHDIAPANLMGCLSIHAKWKKNPHELPHSLKPTHEFYSPFELLTWIKK